MKEERGESAVPPLPLSRVKGVALPALPAPLKSREKGGVEESRGPRTSLFSTEEDAEGEGPYLATSGPVSAPVPALPRVAGALPRAPVARPKQQHLQLPRPRPGPLRSPAPGPAHRRGRAHVSPPPSWPRGERARRGLRALPSRVLALLPQLPSRALVCEGRGCLAPGRVSSPRNPRILTAWGLVHLCVTLMNSDSVTAVCLRSAWAVCPKLSPL